MAETIKLTTLEQLKVALLAAKSYVDGEIGGLGALATKSEVGYDDLAAALKTLIDGKADGTAVATLIGEDAGKSARAISAEEVAKVVANADADFDTLKEIADWILSDTTGAAKMAADIDRLDAILDGIGDTTSGEYATVVAYVEAMIAALNIGDYVKTATMTEELAKKVDKVEGSRLMTNDEGTKLGGIAAGAQVNVIEKVKVNGTELTVTDKAVDVIVPTGALASLDKVAEANLDDALKEKVNAAAEGNHSHNNKALLDTYTQTEADLADAVAKKHEHANAAVLDGITAEKVAAWDAAEGNAKAYADEKNTAMDTRVKALEAASHTHTYATDDEVTAMCTEVFGV